MPEETNLYKPDDSGDKPAVPRPRAGSTVAWTASEYIEHNHGTGWYFGLAFVTATLAVITSFLPGTDYFAVGTIVVVGLIVGVAAARKPQVIDYAIDSSGINVGEKTYPYSLFKSFSVIDEGAVSSVSLLPIKRLMPPLSIYLSPQDEDKVVDALGKRLPYEERQMDKIDRLSRRLRF